MQPGRQGAVSAYFVCSQALLRVRPQNQLCMMRLYTHGLYRENYAAILVYGGTSSSSFLGSSNPFELLCRGIQNYRLLIRTGIRRIAFLNPGKLGFAYGEIFSLRMGIWVYFRTAARESGYKTRPRVHFGSAEQAEIRPPRAYCKKKNDETKTITRTNTEPLWDLNGISILF